MPRLLPTLANTLWALASLPRALRFHWGLRDGAATQRQVLRRILRDNATTAVGQAYDFSSIDSVSAFQDRVPLTTYADWEDSVDRVAAGEDGVLTTAPVRLLEPTSGSTAATKWIPYTDTLQSEFQRAVAPWILDLFRHHPHLLTGSAYWSVSPVGDRPERTDGGVPVGFADDSDYLGPVQGRLVRAVMAVPPCVRRIRDVDTFRYVTLLGLLRRADLRLVSVWNPTFCTLLLARLPDWGDRLAADLAAGTLTPPGSLPDSVREALDAQWGPSPNRAAVVRTALDDAPPTRHRRLWPDLQVVSCWADGPASGPADDLAALLPHASLQPKGLLATEGVVSIPMTGAPGGVPAVRSHFFEFLPADGGPPVLLDALETGARYDVVLTTGGGLYRYRLRDRVAVTGRWRGVPCLRFVGKTDRVVDRFGEKLNARHVQRVLDAAFADHDLAPTFAMLAPDDRDPPGYTLFLRAAAPDAVLRAVGRRVEAGLRDNYHYDYCRRLGQLGPLRLFRVTGDARATYQERCVARGQRAGDVKPTALHAATNWSAHFRGGVVAAPSTRTEDR
jgi:hypothetical protein